MPVVRPRLDTAELSRNAASGRVLDAAFFARPALNVARALLGRTLVRRLPDGAMQAWPITETEAYVGAHDLASHARAGRTARTAPMFGPPGRWYVYFIYGVHWMLNVVTDDVDVPAAVLIRAAGPADGPGKLTKRMSLDAVQNDQPAAVETALWIEDRGLTVPRREIAITPRIGVDYAGDWAAKPYRFVWTKPRS
ncbi:MAG: DNA-3-methyladenine glycosylase [Pirellulales bacterium]